MLEAMQGHNTMTTSPNVQDLTHFGAGLGGQGKVRGLPPNSLLPLPAHSLAVPALTLALILIPVFLTSRGSQGPPRGEHLAGPVFPCPHRRWRGQKSEGIQLELVRRLVLAGSESPWMERLGSKRNM